MQEARRMLIQKEEDARKAGMKEPWEKAVETEIGKVETAIQAICGQFHIDVPTIPGSRPFAGYSGRLSAVLQNLRGQGPAKTQTELSTRRTSLELARGSYSTAQDAVNNKRNQVQKSEPEISTRQELCQKTAVLKELRDEKQTKLDE